MGARPVPSLGPAIARILRQYPTVRLDQVRPSGKNGRILKGDVLAAMEDGSAYANAGGSGGGGGGAADSQLPAGAGRSTPLRSAARRSAAAHTTPSRSAAAAPAAAPPPAGVPAMDASSGGSRVKYHDEPLSSARQATASALLAAKRDIPHRYTSVSFELDALLALQASLNGGARARGGAPSATPITITDFCVWASAAALSAVPEVRATWDAAVGRRMPSRTADVAFVVDTPDGGSLTPIVWDSGRKGLATIAADAAALTDRVVQGGGLDAAEYTGGCFCVSDHSARGVGVVRPVVLAPHAGHLAVGAAAPASRPSPTGGARPVLVATATLSSDARVVSDAAAAEFVAAFVRVMGDPEGSLL